MIWLLLTALLAAPLNLFAQDNGVTSLSFDLIDEAGEIVLWHKNWRYHPGDNLEWANPDLDDSAWEIVHPALGTDDLPREGWSERGWFRLHVKADSSIWNQPLGIGYHFSCAAEVYLNGEPVFSIGQISDSNEPTEIAHGEGAFPITLPSRETSVIAVRYASTRGEEYLNRDHQAGFEMVISEFNSLLSSSKRRTVRQSSSRWFFTGLLLAFAFLHLMLYLYYPIARENLYYAAFTGSFASLIFIIESVSFAENADTLLALMRILGVSIIALNISGLRFMYSLFYKEIPKQFWIFLPFGMLLCIDPWHIPLRYVYVFSLVALFEMLRTILLANYRKVEGSLIIGVGCSVFIVSVAYTLLLQVGVIEFTSDWQRYLFGTLGLMGSFSVYLSRSFGRTNKGLEKANLELEDYSRTLEDRVQSRTKELHEKNTELEDTLQQLRDTQNQLIMNEKMAALGNLVAGVAHEVNNPIGAVKSASDVSARCIEKIETLLDEMAVSVRDSDPFQRALKILKENNRITITGSDRISRIVQSLKNFARLDESEFQEADIHEGIDSTLTLIEHQLKNRITVSKTFGTIPRIRCYPNQLNQVFMNILVNAVHAIEDEGEIRIETTVENENLLIEISDTGKGIPTANLDQIFSPGFTTKGVGVGTGLGLSISYNIIQKHNGKIHAQSEEGSGTTITITLPTNLNRSPKR